MCAITTIISFVTCPVCNGDGIVDNSGNPYEDRSTWCWRCLGSGRVVAGQRTKIHHADGTDEWYLIEPP